MAKKILVVDDEASFTKLLSLNLEDTGDYEVRVENDPAKATQAARYFEPDLILLDVLMPEISGLQLAEEWRQDPGLSSIPIAFLTAAMSKDSPTVENPLLESCPVLVKPVRLSELITVIETHT